MNKTTIYVIIIFIIIFFLKECMNKKTTENADIKENINKYPYTLKKLLTKTEYLFYKELKQKCPADQYTICPKIRMEDFLNVTDKTNLMKYRGYIKSRHIDFMLCDIDLHIIAGIELDDESHSKATAIKTDKFKDELFKTIGLPLFRIKVSETYNESIDNMLNQIQNK